MSDSFFASIQDAGAGLISSLRLSLLEVGAMCDSAGLSQDDFQNESGHIFAALMEAWRSGEQYDFIRLVSRLRKTSRFSDAGAIERINSFFGKTAHPSAADSYIHTLLEARAARKMHELGSRLVARAFDASTDVQELLEAAQAELSAVNARPETKHKHISHFIDQILEDLDEPEKHHDSEVIEIGLGIDESAGPFGRGDLLVIAGCTKGGKSALANNIIENVSIKGRLSAMFSFEMTGKQSVERILASQAYVNMRELKTTLMANSGQLATTFSREETEKSKVKHAGASARKWKVEIFEKLKGIEQVTAEMARMKALGGLDVALIDYAQLIRGLRSKGDSREREVASISYEFKQACMRNECLGILLSQLTVDSNGSAHLRESRALGQDANCVLFIEGDGQDKRLRVVAARSAPSGTLIELHWQEEFTKFSAK